MARVLVVFGTVEGQTEKIAKAVTGELRKMGHSVDLKDASDNRDAVHVAVYGGVVVGAPVHYSGYPASVQKWIKANAKELSARPTAFFSVGLGILHKNDRKAQSDQQKIVQDLFEWSGWHPNHSSIFAGALPYSKYGLVKRLFMKVISRSGGADTDTSRDYEYTNWEDVRRFSNEFNTVLINTQINTQANGQANAQVSQRRDTRSLKAG